jgi:HK97 family phage prohead protease
MMGDVVVQSGADLSIYKRNPIVLFSHQPESPVGTASGLRIENGCLTADIQFAPEGLSQKADEVCALVKAGILKSVSIGFDPIEAEPLNPSRPRGPQRYLRWVLCEISVVAIPANNDAVVTAKSARRASSAETPDRAQRRARVRHFEVSAPPVSKLERRLRVAEIARAEPALSLTERAAKSPYGPAQGFASEYAADVLAAAQATKPKLLTLEERRARVAAIASRTK